MARQLLGLYSVAMLAIGTIALLTSRWLRRLEDNPERVPQWLRAYFEGMPRWPLRWLMAETRLAPALRYSRQRFEVTALLCLPGGAVVGAIALFLPP